MNIQVNGKPIRRRRGNRGRAFDRTVLKFAGLITELQASGYVNSRELAAELNRRNIPSPSGGQWSDAPIFRMMKRGVELGLPFKRRDRSYAASRRKVIRRSKDVIQAEMNAGTRSLVQALAALRDQTDAGTTASLLLRRR